ncbi:hypothetical protein TKK_0004889 [Trichogramma kaykai]
MAAGVYEASLLLNGVLMRANLLPDQAPVQPGDVAQPCRPQEDAAAAHAAQPAPAPAGANRADTGNDHQLITYAQYAALAEEIRNRYWMCYVSPLLESYGECDLPQPRDYNVFQRIMNIKRTEDGFFLTELTNLTVLDEAERLMLTASFAAEVTFFVTTALTTMNVIGRDVQRWAIRAANISPLLYAIAQQGFFANINNSITSRAGIYRMAFLLLRQYLGGSVPIHVASIRHWNRPLRQWPFAHGPFHIASPLHPPRLGNPMSLMGYLQDLPCEWGLVDDSAIADFSHETVQMGLGAQWDGAYGTAEYMEYRTSPFPCQNIAYGPLAMNVISQGLREYLPAGQPIFRYNRFRQAQEGSWNHVEVDDMPLNPLWLADYRCFEPCTLMTFIYDNLCIYSPRLRAADGNQRTVDVLSNAPLNVGFKYGFVLRIRQAGQANYFVFPVPDFLRALPPVPMPGLLAVPELAIVPHQEVQDVEIPPGVPQLNGDLNQ